MTLSSTMHSHFASRRALRLSVALSAGLLAGFLPACGGGGGGGDAGTSNVTLNTVSGRINGPGGVPLPGVTIEFEGDEAVTGSNGAFILPEPGTFATGSYLVGIDGSTTSVAGAYPALEVVVEIIAGQTDVVLPQVVTLPNLESAEAGNQAVALNASGATTEAIALVGPDGDIELEGLVGTVIRVNDVLATGNVDFNVTPVPANEVPMPLPDGLLASSFVTVQPGNGRFAQPNGNGLNVRLPNDAGFPVGTEVDIWSFDHDDGDWVNRTEETGNSGVVVDLGGGMTAVDADGVITEGGWHGPVIPVDPNCATTVTGRVVDTDGNTLTNVSVSTTLGNFGMSLADGSFELTLVPAYEVAALPDCIAIDLGVTAASPPLLGSVTSEMVVVQAADVVLGGITDVGDIVLELPNAGCVTGIVNGMLVSGSRALVSINGPTNTTVMPGPSGTFSVCDLAPGAYTACAQFVGEPEETCASFTIVANALATVTLQVQRGQGDGDLTVRVVNQGFNPSMDPDPVPGALVHVVGSDGGSSGGLLMMSDSSGEATFQGVTGPFQITAWAEFLQPNSQFVLRQAVTVNDLAAVGGLAVLSLGLDLTDVATPAITDANLAGMILNNGEQCPVSVSLSAPLEDDALFFSAFLTDLVDSYASPVVSGVPIDMVVSVGCPGGSTDTSSAAIFESIPALAPEEMRTLDIDLNSSEFVDFDVPVAVTIENETAYTSTQFTLGSFDLISLSDNLFGNFGLFAGTGAAPTTWDLPPLESGVFDGFQARYLYSSSGQFGTDQLTGSQFRIADIASPTPSALTVSLLDLPVLSAPATPITTSTPGGLTFVFTPPASPAGLAGFEEVSLAGAAFDPSAGTKIEPVIVTWSLYAAEGTTTIELPAIAAEILETGEFGASVKATRYAETVDFEAAFTTGGFGSLFDGVQTGTFTSSQVTTQLTVTGTP